MKLKLIVLLLVACVIVGVAVLSVFVPRELYGSLALSLAGVGILSVAFHKRFGSDVHKHGSSSRLLGSSFWSYVLQQDVQRLYFAVGIVLVLAAIVFAFRFLLRV